MPDVQNQAASTIQSAYRGFRARRQHRLPQTLSPIEYHALIRGNEPEIVLPAHNSNRFLWVGCSSLKNLQMVLSISSPEKARQDGYTNIPKLYIIDNSENVHTLWKIVKKSMHNAKTLDDFRRHLKEQADILKQNCRYDPNGKLPHEDIDSYLVELIKFSSQPKNFRDHFYARLNIQHKRDSQNVFLFIKHIIEKTTIINADWKDMQVFDYIKTHHPVMPIYIYASNIIEYVGRETGINDVDTVLNNISLLNPEKVIHTRTSHDRGRMYGPYPDEFIILANESTETTKQILCNPRFMSLVKPEQKNHTPFTMLTINGRPYLVSIDVLALLLSLSGPHSPISSFHDNESTDSQEIDYFQKSACKC